MLFQEQWCVLFNYVYFWVDQEHGLLLHLMSNACIFTSEYI